MGAIRRTSSYSSSPSLVSFEDFLNMDGFASSGGHPSDSDKSPELALGMPMGMALLSVDQSISVSLPPAQASLASSSSSTPVPSSSGRAKSLKRFECDYPDCDKTFSTSGHLARHVRVHTGEKAFQCTFPECQSRFSRHDNMLQHYRNHIVRNARRRKKAFASAIASGNIGLTSKGEPYDDPNPPSHSTSSRIPLSASTSTSTSSSSTAARPSGPIFVHSPYSSLSQSQLGGSSRTTGGAAARSGQSLGSSTSGGNAGGTIASRRGPVVSPLLGPNHASSHTRPTHLNLDSLDPRDDPFARQQQQLQQQHYHQYPHPHPASASSAPSSFLSPPLASPSVMDRPHTATTSFFPAFITGATGADPQNSVTIHPPPLMHRHSYSALTNHPVLEPITPTSELPSYPSYYTHPHHQGHPHYSEHAHLHGYHQQQHPYPTSPGPYSPTLSASPSLVDGTLTPLHEPATYFQPMAQNTLYPDRYSTAGGGTSMQTHHLIPHHHHPAHHAASYPPNQPHSGTSAIASPYLLQPHSATTAGSNAAARSAISHSSLGSHNPLLSGLGVGEDTLTTGTRSSSLSTGSGGMSTHLAQPSESGTSILGDTTSYSSTSATPASSTSGPTPVSAPSSTASSLSNAPVTARWLQSPSAGISGNVGDYSITQSHPGWQPDIRGSGNVTPSLNIAGETASLSVVDPSEERPFASARAGLDDHQQFLQESVTWGPYGREM